MNQAASIVSRVVENDEKPHSDTIPVVQSSVWVSRKQGGLETHSKGAFHCDFTPNWTPDQLAEILGEVPWFDMRSVKTRLKYGGAVVTWKPQLQVKDNGTAPHVSIAPLIIDVGLEVIYTLSLNGATGEYAVHEESLRKAGWTITTDQWPVAIVRVSTVAVDFDNKSVDIDFR